ncbi:MAG: formylglycine-generating enzyme family protein [Myxococcales bacterium]|nr:formylglycine-generating enzyme family protein [Myxococcales bacterium]
MTVGLALSTVFLIAALCLTQGCADDPDIYLCCKKGAVGDNGADGTSATVDSGGGGLVDLDGSVSNGDGTVFGEKDTQVDAVDSGGGDAVAMPDADATVVDVAIDAASVEDGGSDNDGSVDLDVSISDGGVDSGEMTTNTSCPDSVENIPEGMVFVPCGLIQVGCNSTKDSHCSPNELPQHEVALSAYFIDETEVTVSKYGDCVQANICTQPKAPTDDPTVPGETVYNWGTSGMDNHPINGVSWQQAQTYCQWLGKRLPTEIEWEMAARGSCALNSVAGKPCTDSMRIFPWGDEPPTCELAVYHAGPGLLDYCTESGKGFTNPVGSKPAGKSPYGVLDMSGNLWEWVYDCYTCYPKLLDDDEPCVLANTDTCGTNDVFRVTRGGGFPSDGSTLRGSLRGGVPASSQLFYLGFRCAKSVE